MSAPTVRELEEAADWNRDAALRFAMRLGSNTLSEDAVYAAIVQAHVQMVGMLRREAYEAKAARPALELSA